MNNKGFTLIEVLIASLILFTSIATMTLLYKNVLLASSKAEQQVKMSTMLPVILNNIRTQIREHQGNSEINQNDKAWQIAYSWSAKLIKQQPLRVNSFTETEEKDDLIKNVKLWQVELQLNLGSAKKHYQFKEVNWAY